MPRQKQPAGRRRRRSPSPVDPRQHSPDTGDYEDEEQPGGPSVPEKPTTSKLSPETPAAGKDTAGTSVVPRAGGAECWKHFTKNTEMCNGKLVVVSATCKYCKKEYSAGSRGGTGHLNRHYEACLKKYSKHEQGGGVQTQLNIAADGSVSTWVYNSDVARQEIARYIAVEDLPIRMGESPAFERMIQRAFCPQYSNVSRKTTKKDIVKSYHEKWDALRQSLSALTFSIALTSDIWTSSHQRTSYLSVVAHYLDSKYRLNKRVIGFKDIDESHTGEAIASQILEVIQEYKIEDRVVSITLDNASANTSAMNTLEPYIQSYIGGYVLHQRCVCHIINLIVQSGMSQVSKHLSSIRSAIRFLSTSPLAYSKFKEYCKVRGKKPRKFGLDMKVRWNSTYHMLKQVKGYEKIFTNFINAQDIGIVLTNTDWQVVASLCDFLEPFYNATTQLSGIYYPTSPLVLEWLMKIVDTFQEKSTDRMLAPIVAAMKEKYLKYFDAIPHLYCFAIVLDPRKKLDGLDTAFRFIGDALDLDYSSAYSHVKSEIFRVFDMYQDKFGQTRPRSEAAQNEKPKNTAAANMWKKLKSRDSSSSQTARSSWNPRAEFNHYLEIDHVSHDPRLQEEDDQIDLLGWWKDNEHQFPVLSQFARDVLLVPVSTVSSESTFSTVGTIIEERRSSLAPEMVEALTCLKDWEAADTRQQHQLEDQEIAQAMADLELEDEE